MRETTPPSYDVPYAAFLFHSAAQAWLRYISTRYSQTDYWGPTPATPL